MSEAIRHDIKAAKAGDKAAYGRVVAACADRLVAVLTRVVGNQEDARDIAQDTFVRIYRHLEKFDHTKPFEPWLYRVGRNLAYNHLRSVMRRREKLTDVGSDFLVDEMKSETKSPIDDVLDKERQYNIDGVLARMRPAFREVMTLRYMLKLEYDEIARRMEVPIGTIKTWLNRAKEQFRRLAEEGRYF